MIKYKGTTLYPPALFEVMDNVPEINSYVVEVYSNEYNNDEILIRYDASENSNLKNLIDHFKTKARVTPQLLLTSSAELNQLIFPKMSRKPVKFIDRREKQFYLK